MVTFLRKIFKPKLSREAFIAYYYKLPDSVSISWQRDGGFIVGSVKAGNHKFMTQGKNADDFIEMVNDSIIAVHDIPEDYIDVLRKNKTYLPSDEEWLKLNNGKVMKSRFSFIKEKRVLQRI